MSGFKPLLPLHFVGKLKRTLNDSLLPSFVCTEYFMSIHHSLRYPQLTHGWPYLFFLKKRVVFAYGWIYIHCPRTISVWSLALCYYLYENKTSFIATTRDGSFLLTCRRYDWFKVRLPVSPANFETARDHVFSTEKRGNCLSFRCGWHVDYAETGNFPHSFYCLLSFIYNIQI